MVDMVDVLNNTATETAAVTQTCLPDRLLAGNTHRGAFPRISKHPVRQTLQVVCSWLLLWKMATAVEEAPKVMEGARKRGETSEGGYLSDEVRDLSLFSLLSSGFHDVVKLQRVSKVHMLS